MVIPPAGRAREEGPLPLATPLPLPASRGRPGPVARLLRRPRRDVIGHRAFLVALLKSLAAAASAAAVAVMLLLLLMRPKNDPFYYQYCYSYCYQSYF